MKKIILLLSSLAFVCFSCEHIGIQGLGFDYEIEFDVPVEGPIPANTPMSYETEDIQNKLQEEMDRRGIQFIENIQLTSISLSIPENSLVDFSFLDSFSASLKMDGKVVPLKFVGQIEELAAQGGKSLRIMVDESTPDFAELRDVKKLGLKYSISLKKPIEDSFELKADLNTKIFASFIE